MKKTFISILGVSGILTLSLFLSSCKNEKKVDPISDNNRVFYEIFTASFSDSNQDGYGDLNGILNRLDYLNDGDINSNQSLGIQGIWLTPIYESSSYHKYDTTNYYTVDSHFGSNDDLVNLVNACHERNVKVILDLAINHTSKGNEWFIKFKTAHQNNDTTNTYYDWYSWSKEKKTSEWYSIPGTAEYYEGNFSSSMPELNYDNEAVREEMLNVAKFWLNLGVDGFRFDAAKYIYYGETAKSASFWDWYIGELKKIKSDIYTVAEVWSGDSETASYEKYLSCFDFQMSGAEGFINQAAKGSGLTNFTHYVSLHNEALRDLREDSIMCSFSSNHDQNRSWAWLNSEENYKMAANLYLLSPGSPFIYYGEEIAMQGSRIDTATSKTDANRRLAMLWGDGDTVKDPSEANFYTQGKTQKNGTVSDQLNDDNSYYNYYKKLILLRNKYEAIARGSYESIENIGDSAIGGFKITYKDEVIYILHNTQAKNVSADISSLGDLALKDSIGLGNASLSKNTITLGKKTTAILT